MPTISGKWKWNDVISAIPDNNLIINFTSNSKSFIQMIVERDVAGNVLFYVEDVTTTYVDAYNLYDNTWTDEAYKTIDFGSEEQAVSEDFYTYLTANATRQETPTTTKTVSSDNLARFKQKCDETYAAIGNIPTVSTELVNLGTLSTSGTLTTDQVTQIGTTTIGVTARASVNGVTRFYERVNISGTTATLVSADDDALHVLTVNLSTRAYTLSDVALGGGGSGPDIPTPTTADNGKVLGVSNGAYALLNERRLYRHRCRWVFSSGNITATCYLILITAGQSQYEWWSDVLNYLDYFVSGYITIDGTTDTNGVVVDISTSDSVSIDINYISSNSLSKVTGSSETSFTDTVTPL